MITVPGAGTSPPGKWAHYNLSLRASKGLFGFPLHKTLAQSLISSALPDAEVVEVITNRVSLDPSLKGLRVAPHATSIRDHKDRRRPGYASRGQLSPAMF